MTEDDDAVARAELAMHLRRNNVASTATLAAVESVPRSLFLSARDKRLAYADRAAPIECGQTISQPTVVAMMTDALNLTPDCTVLEIGTGSGYQTAILAKLAGHVYSVERYRLLRDVAAERLSALKINNVSLTVGDGREGWPDHAPFDRVIVTAAAPAVPEALVEQMADDGVLVVPVGDDDGAQNLMRCHKGPNGLEGESLASVRFVPIVPGVADAL